MEGPRHRQGRTHAPPQHSTHTAWASLPARRTKLLGFFCKMWAAARAAWRPPPRRPHNAICRLAAPQQWALPTPPPTAPPPPPHVVAAADAASPNACGPPPGPLLPIRFHLPDTPLCATSLPPALHSHPGNTKRPAACTEGSMLPHFVCAQQPTRGCLLLCQSYPGGARRLPHVRARCPSRPRCRLRPRAPGVEVAVFTPAACRVRRQGPPSRTLPAVVHSHPSCS